MLCLELLGDLGMSSVPGIGTAYSVNAAESLVFHAGEHKPDSKRNCFAVYTINKGCPTFICLTRPPCGGLFASVYTAPVVKWNLLVQALLDAASNSQ